MLIAIPKGRLYGELHYILEKLDLLQENSRKYSRQTKSGILCKFLKIQDIPVLLHEGYVDLGFVSEEWVREQDVELVRLVELDPYKYWISAITSTTHQDVDSMAAFLVKFSEKPIRVVSPYERITRLYLNQLDVKFQMFKVSGSAEAYVPELADLIIDCVETGETIRANGLKVIDTVLCCKIILAANTDYYETHQAYLQGLIHEITAILETRFAI